MKYLITKYLSEGEKICTNQKSTIMDLNNANKYFKDAIKLISNIFDTNQLSVIFYDIAKSYSQKGIFNIANIFFKEAIYYCENNNIKADNYIYIKRDYARNLYSSLNLDEALIEYYSLIEYCKSNNYEGTAEFYEKVAKINDIIISLNQTITL